MSYLAKAREPISSLSHCIGAVVFAAATLLLVGKTLFDDWSPKILVGVIVFGVSLVALYSASAIYHFSNGSAKRILRLRKLDHSMIYVLIAGSYTPICMTVLWGGVGGPLLLAIWLCAAAGIILTITKLDIPRWLTSVIYLAMGWMALFAIAPLSRVLPAAGMFWLIAGGVLYTVGGVLYAVKWPGRNNPRFGCHEIFHVFIVLGSVSHFILMYSVVAPL